MTCIVDYPTKKALREAVELNAQKVLVEDPSIFNPKQFHVADLVDGEEVVVTNHPKRSWFAQVGRRNGRLYVK